LRALSWPARRHSISSGGARVAATLAADTVFSHVLGEGIGAEPVKLFETSGG